MKKEDFKNKKVTVMGVGLHGGGAAAISFFSRSGARVIATDMKSEKELATSLKKLKDLKNVEFVLGQHRMEDFTNVDLVVKGPAISWSSKYIQEALKKKIPVEMDSSLFFQMVKLPIIGITGTKGKTTTATLIFEILKNSGQKVFSAGIGQGPVLDADILEEISRLNSGDRGNKNNKGVVVFELSSWRLSALGRVGLSPNISVITNIYPDHLNYYSSMEKYIADKKFIFANQNPEDFAVLNYDNEITRELASEVKSQVVFFSTEAVGNSISKRRSNLHIEKGKIVYEIGEDKTEVCDLNDIKIKGAHNLYNVLAAVAATLAFETPAERIKETVSQFKGVPHRLELVRELDGVKYYNDTTATTPEAAIAGINSFSAPVILIAGGSDKNLDFEKLAKTVGEKVKKIVLLKGSATEKLKTELGKIGKIGIAEGEFDNIEDAVARAKNISASGDVILLSPGAASFGMFVNEFDRGYKFREAVEKLR